MADGDYFYMEIYSLFRPSNGTHPLYLCRDQ